MRFFNVAGPCNPADHYMLPATERLPDVQRLLDQKAYFVIHGPRQSGKTTAMLELARQLTAAGRYAAALVSMEVGAAFNEVVGASEEMQQRVLESEAYAARRKPDAEGQRVSQVSAAEAYRRERGQVAQAESERFLKQLIAYRACPSMFVLNSYLEVLETEGAATRKYVVATTRGSEVFILDLQDKLRPDLLDLDVEKVGTEQ